MRPRGVGPIGPTDQLLSETFRLGGQRFGHLLPYIVLFVLPIGLAAAVAGWYGLRDTIVTIDEVTAEVDIDYGGSPVALAIYLLLWPLSPISVVAAVVAKAATARQVWTTQAGRPETWSESLAEVARRWRSVLFGALGRTALYWVIGGAFLVGAVVAPAVVLLFPVAAGLLVLVWLRLAFVGQVAALAPPGAGPFSTSLRVSGRQPGRLLVRLVMLVLVGLAVVIVASVIGSIVTALAGIETPAVDAEGSVFVLDAYLGGSAAVFTLNSVFGSLGIGVAMLLTSVGTTLLYRNLGGPIDPALEALVESSDDPADPGPP